MMKKQDRLSLAGYSRRLRPNAVRQFMFWAFVVLAIGIFPHYGNAQFSGPAVGISNPVNVPIAPTTDTAILYPQYRDVILRQGDLLQIHIYGNLDYAPTVRISLNGTVQLPLIGLLHIEGMTVHQAENLIAQELVNAGMYRNPQVTIQMVESPNQTVTITGELHGIVPVAGPRKLYDVLSAAGGLPATASHTITIDRPGVSQPIVVNLGTDPTKSGFANVPIFPGDTIVVSRVGVIYLLGAFKNQGPIPLDQNSPLTLMQVASLGGGAGFEGRLNDLRIIRTVGLDRKVIRVDIKKVLNGQAPDPVLQANDIVLLPTNQMKAAIKSGGLGTLLGIGSLMVLAIER